MSNPKQPVSNHKGIYTIYDKKALFFSTPFFNPNDDVAIREFVRIVNDTNSNICAFPDDYELHKIGEFDDVAGCILPMDVTLLVLGNDVVIAK